VVSGAGPSAEIQAVASKAEALGNTRITVTFDEAVKLPASLVYGAGDAPAATLVDEAGNRAPAVQLEITKGRMPEDKETAATNGAGISHQSKAKKTESLP
jgi:C4-dicarboxylate transporter